MQRRSRFTVLLALAAIVTACAPARPTATSTPKLQPTVIPTPTPEPTATPPPIEFGLVDVGGYKLYISCQGDGSPTIVFDAGLSWSGLQEWTKVVTQIPSNLEVRACRYDRAFTGQSEPAETRPRTSMDMVTDLHALLSAAHVPGPYVLVGHSLGGYTVILYADTYPDQVAGAVLVDSASPDELATALAVYTEERATEHPVVQQVRTNYLLPHDHPLESPEFWDAAASTDLVHAVSTLGDLPMEVLVRDVNDHSATMALHQRGGMGDIPPELVNEFEEQWLSLQEKLAELSTASTITIVPNTSHLIPLEAPHAVVEAIVRVVNTVRESR